MTGEPRGFRLRLHGDPVATLVEGGRGTGHPSYLLQFEPAWVDRIERPILSLGALDWRLDVARRFPGRLPPFLTNLLPEQGGALRRRIARAAAIDEQDDLALLAFVGRDMSGALTCEPVAGVEPTRRIVDQPEPSPLPPAHRLRWSLGGIQLKFSVERRDRVSLPLHGRGSWILKLPDGKHPGLARAEYAAMEWARAVGFDVPDVDLLDPHEVEGLPPDACDNLSEALLIRRFDRGEEGRSIHMEEMASVLRVHPEHKYPDPPSPHAYNLVVVGRLVRRFAGEDALHTFVARVVFDVLVGNGDAHLKNWAFLFPDGRTPRLAPAYDILPTVLYGYPPELALPFTSEKAFRAVDEGRIRQFALKLDASPADLLAVVKRTVHRAVATFDGVMERSGLPAESVRVLRRHWEGLPISRLG